ncbi:hypothetical protein SAMN05421748_11253 [Paractinoplanes atraurantiacus]|uniref:Uncharacterized protein n=1 Tax=Paractinoplanes atraurantiacus TaxID=1036182 RepID=A0A285IUK7_9ACTN|nr:hypothetical protein SAMN05421748_11253 [Actinoplanes atraurantiacus]
MIVFNYRWLRGRHGGIIGYAIPTAWTLHSQANEQHARSDPGPQLVARDGCFPPGARAPPRMGSRPAPRPQAHAATFRAEHRATDRRSEARHRRPVHIGASPEPSSVAGALTARRSSCPAPAGNPEHHHSSAATREPKQHRSSKGTGDAAQCRSPAAPRDATQRRSPGAAGGAAQRRSPRNHKRRRAMPQLRNHKRFRAWPQPCNHKRRRAMPQLRSCKIVPALPPLHSLRKGRAAARSGDRWRGSAAAEGVEHRGHATAGRLVRRLAGRRRIRASCAETSVTGGRRNSRPSCG